MGWVYFSIGIIMIVMSVIGILSGTKEHMESNVTSLVFVLCGIGFILASLVIIDRG